jgi:DNA-binding response OmpR family regulator
MIDERCRDCTFDTFTNIIDVCVNYLRKKMDSRRYSKLEFTYSSTSSIFF